MLYCLVDPQGGVHSFLDAVSFHDAAEQVGLDERACQEYRFDLTTRQLLVDRGTPPSALAVQEYLNQRVGSPERLMVYAATGELPKKALADLLVVEQRPSYLSACARIERQYTEACMAKNDPCLPSGCSVQGEDEICLQPLLDAGVEYHQACAAEWLKRFREPASRIAAWRN